VGRGRPRKLAPALKRGQVYLVQLSPAVGTELHNPHPCIVVQSDLLEHRLRPRTIVVPLTSRAPNKPLPFVIEIQPPEGGLTKVSYALCDQVTRIDKSRVLRLAGDLTPSTMSRIDTALRLALEL